MKISAAVWMVATTQSLKQGKQRNSRENLTTIRDYIELDNYDYFDIVLDVSRKNNGIKNVRHDFDIELSELILDQYRTRDVLLDYSKKRTQQKKSYMASYV